MARVLSHPRTAGGFNLGRNRSRSAEEHQRCGSHGRGKHAGTRRAHPDEPADDLLDRGRPQAAEAHLLTILPNVIWSPGGASTKPPQRLASAAPAFYAADRLVFNTRPRHHDRYGGTTTTQTKKK